MVMGLTRAWTYQSENQGEKIRCPPTRKPPWNSVIRGDFSDNLPFLTRDFGIRIERSRGWPEMTLYVTW